MLLPVLAATVFLAVALGVYGAARLADDRRAVRTTLLAIDDHAFTRLRDRQLLGSLGERVMEPMFRRLGELGRRVTPAGYIDQSRRKLTILGHSGATAFDRVLAARAATIVAIPVGLYAVNRMIGFHSDAGLLIGAFVVLLLVLGPDAVLNRRMAARQERIKRQLPDILDLLTISIEAGLGFDQALDRTVSSIKGDLADEFSRMLGEIRAGADRADALRSIDARTDVPELRAFVLAVLQAETFGVSIGRVLRAQAKEARIKRRQLAEEQGRKAPVKMLVPMVVCVFPALFVVVLGPAVINIMHTLSHNKGF